MRAILFGFISLFLIVFPASGDIAGLLTRVESLHEDYQHGEIITLIGDPAGQAATNREKAELYWRLSRATLYSGDIAEENGRPKAEILGYFEKAEALADEAIKLDPSLADAYYWKASAMGRWGQVKGVLNSLAKAKPMKIELEKALNQDGSYRKAFQVLGMLYEALPGWPISFGDADHAVSLGRKALDIHLAEVKNGREARFDYSVYRELARELYKRNWDSSKRERGQQKKRSRYASTTDILEKNYYYEGTITIPAQSDREEARAILTTVIETLSKMTDRTRYNEIDLQKTRELLAEWGG